MPPWASALTLSSGSLWEEGRSAEVPRLQLRAPATAGQSCLHPAHAHGALTKCRALFQALLMGQQTDRRVPVVQMLTVQRGEQCRLERLRQEGTSLAGGTGGGGSSGGPSRKW